MKKILLVWLGMIGMVFGQGGPVYPTTGVWFPGSGPVYNVQPIGGTITDSNGIPLATVISLDGARIYGTITNLSFINAQGINLTATNISTRSIIANYISVDTLADTNAAPGQLSVNNVNTYVETFIGTNLAYFGTPTAGIYPRGYATDIVTVKGVGGMIKWDGVNWRTDDGVIATTDETQFILNSNKAALNSDSPTRIVRYYIDNTTIGNGGHYGRVGIAAGTGSFVSTSTVSTNGCPIYFSTGSTAAGAYYSYFLPITAPATGTVYGFGGQYAVNALSDAIQTYTATVGFTSLSTTNYPVEGAYFYYDSSKTVDTGMVNNQTNNWVCVTAHGSSYVYMDSGVPVSVGIGSPQFLDIILTSTSAKFYINKNLVQTITTQLPTKSLFPKTILLKAVGITPTLMYEYKPHFHYKFIERNL